MNRLSLIPAFAIGLCCGALAGGELGKEVDAFLEPIPTEFQKGPTPFEGTWKVIRVEQAGAPVAAAKWRLRDELTFSGDVLVGLESADKADESFVTVAKDTKPVRVARWLERRSDGTYTALFFLGVAEIREDKLYWCEGPVRRVTKEFKTAPGDERTLIVAERVK